MSDILIKIPIFANQNFTKNNIKDNERYSAKSR